MYTCIYICMYTYIPTAAAADLWVVIARVAIACVWVYIYI